MDEISPPAIDPDAKPIRVPGLKFKRDAGTSWARALDTEQVADLIDLAGELAVIFPVIKERRITERTFESKLRDMGQYEHGVDKLARIIGHTDGLVTLYHIWWSYAWVANYTRASLSKDREEKTCHDETARRMGIKPGVAMQRLARRDVSYLVNLFFVRLAREHEGQVAWRATQDAINGGSRALDTFYRHVKSNEDTGTRGGEFDPFQLTEAELMADIEKKRKRVGKKHENWRLPSPGDDGQSGSGQSVA